MVGLIFLFIFISAFIFLITLWVSGIDFMMQNHPDYKGEDLIDADLKNWDSTVADGLDKKKMNKATHRTTLEDLHKVLGPEFVKQGQKLREIEEELLSNIIKKMRTRIYLDDVRTPIDPDWIVVRNYDEFVSKVTEIGLENIELISLDHDLGPSAMAEWHSNVYHKYELNYDNITEKTGMDCTKWLVEQWLDGAPVVDVVIHSANAIGSANMMGMINNYRHIHRLPQNCIRVQIEHTV